jgi:anthranilate phosphoribosyltransferase
MLLGVLNNSDDPAIRPAIDIVALNAGAALYAANVCADMGEGIAMARSAIESGAAARKLAELKAHTAANAAAA